MSKLYSIVVFNKDGDVESNRIGEIEDWCDFKSLYGVKEFVAYYLDLDSDDLGVKEYSPFKNYLKVEYVVDGYEFTILLTWSIMQ